MISVTNYHTGPHWTPYDHTGPPEPHQQYGTTLDHNCKTVEPLLMSAGNVYLIKHKVQTVG